jgi:3-oxoacyl-ACP reductase-like protein
MSRRGRPNDDPPNDGSNEETGRRTSIRISNATAAAAAAAAAAPAAPAAPNITPTIQRQFQNIMRNRYIHNTGYDIQFRAIFNRLRYMGTQQQIEDLVNTGERYVNLMLTTYVPA